MVSLDKEVVRLTGANHEVQRKIPHGVYTDRYWKTSTPVLLGLLGVFAWSIHLRRYRLKPVEWAIVLIPAIYFLILCFIPITSNRYFLPCGVLAACLSAAALSVVQDWKYGKWIALSLIVISTIWSAPRLIKANQGFKADHLGELVKVLETELPSESFVIIGEDLTIPPIQLPQSTHYAIEAGETLESLRKKGFTHIIVTPHNYSKYLRQAENRTHLGDADFAQVKEFYESLFGKATMLRDWKEGSTYPTKPLTLFSLQEK